MFKHIQFEKCCKKLMIWKKRENQIWLKTKQQQQRLGNNSHKSTDDSAQNIEMDTIESNFVKIYNSVNVYNTSSSF